MFRRTATISATVALIAGLALTGCSAGSGTAGAGSTGGGGSTAPAAPATAGLNTPVKVGSFEYTATASKDAGTTAGASPLTKTAQGTFIEVDLTIKNVGTSAATFISNYVKLVDGTGKTYDADPTATLYASPNQSAWVAAINPGNAITGPILFDVPAGTTAASIQVSDNAFSKGETVNLK
ncbi:hypothetical protein A0130_02500 [Leifsonia xyli]|uniref:DUF4352 domain-containing protein n=1 Tax=Leifsonia xyli TaxID=1575 RepID=UPI0007CE0A8D|nr:hypothetical protein A0130_02500 [Leifsonia xyli]